jgi:uncharacterized protein (DUF697 family)
LSVEVIDSATAPALVGTIDAAIVVAGSGGAGAAATVAAARARKIPVAAMALSDEGRAADLAEAVGQPTNDVLVLEDATVLVGSKLAGWLVEAVSGKRLALAHNFAFVRREVAEDAVRTTAVQNALVGTVAIVPGADMPLMTANQAKMIMQIAAAYGEPLTAARLRELAAVVGGGFALRTVARQLLTVVPVLGWAIKGGIGYAGTLAMGKLAIQYFEDGADLTGVLQGLKAAVSDRIPARRLRAANPDAEQLSLAGTVSDVE